MKQPGRSIAGLMQLGLAAVRPLIKRALPTALHPLAGRRGRALMRALDRLTARGAEPGWAGLVEDPSPVLAEDAPVVLVCGTLQAGGAERQFVELAKGLARTGSARVQALIMALREEPQFAFFASDLRGENVTVREPLTYDEARKSLEGRYGGAVLERVEASLTWAPVDHARRIVRLVAEFDCRRPKAIAGWQDETAIATAIAGAICGVPRTIIVTRNLNPTNFGYHRPFMAPAYRRLAREPSVVLLNNSTAGARDYERWLGLEEGRFRVVRNGIDATRFKPADLITRAEARAALGLVDRGPVIGGVFRLSAEKRPLLWLEVAERVLARRPEAWFVHIGSGPLRDSFVRRAEALGIARRLVLLRETTAVPSLLAGFDALLLTSAQEGTPNVVLEASLTGIPVVATAVGGLPETVRDGVTGRLIASPAHVSEADLAAALAEVTLEAIDSEGLRQSARTHGPDFVQSQFGMARMIAEMRAALAL